MEIARTVITGMDNLADAVSMSIINGQNQFDFTGRATTDSTGGGAAPTHCLSSGQVDEIIIAGYEADPRFTVSEKVGRAWREALTEHDPVLYPWINPNGI